MPDYKRKAPAFQFYADDFLAGTMEMSQSEVGAYIRLLCHQWNRGSIPVETEKQQRLAGGSVSVDVLSKFPADEEGFLKNKRLETERDKQAIYREQQRKKGLLSAEARRNLNHGSTAVGTAVQPSHQPEGQPDTQPEGNSPSPSPSYLLTKDYSSTHTEPEEVVCMRARIGSWFNRRPTTKWSDEENRALRKVLKLNTPPEDIDLLEKRYLSKAPFIRREIVTLLNNWNGEIDKARNPEQVQPYQPRLIGTSTPDNADF